MPGVLEAITFLVIAAQAGALGAGLAALGFSFTGLIGVGLSIGASYLSALIFRPQAPRPEDVQQSVKNPVAQRVRHYGRVKVSGPWVFGEAKGGNFHKVMALGTGELDAFEEYWIDDTQVTLDVNGFVQTAPWFNVGDPVCRILTRRGEAIEQWYPELENQFPEYDEDHRGDGVSSAYARQESLPPEQIYNNFPNLTQTSYRFVVRGSKIYNPITGTTAWTDNAAAVIRDYMTHPDGMGLPASMFTTTQATAGWLAAANRAAELVDLKAGGTEARYRIWGSYYFNERPADVLGRMLLSCDGRIVPTADGGITLDIGTWAEPTVIIDDELIAGFEIQRGRDILTTANIVAATYMSPNHDYQTIDADRWIDEDDVSLRGEIVTDTSFIMTPSHAQCRRLMKLAAYRAKPNWLGSVQCNLGALAAFGERFIRLTYAPFGINEVMEVKDFRFNISDGGILSSVTIEFQSMPQEAYNWDPETEEGTEPINEDTDVDTTVPVPTNFAAAIVETTSGFTTTYYAEITFDLPPYDSLTTQVNGRRVGDADWIPIPVATGAASTQSFALLEPFEYEFRARHLAALGTPSEWTDTLTLPASPRLNFALTGNSQYLPLI